MSALGEHAAPDGLSREFVTPEGVDLRLQLADAGERAAAFFLDIMIILLTLVVMTIGLLLLGFAFGFRGAQYMGMIWILSFFLLRNFYFVAFELSPRAATPGKRMIGLRVAMRDGSALTANAVFARNAMRELEVFLPLTFMAYSAAGVDSLIGIVGLAWSGVFVFFPLFNRDRLRIGDLVGGTWVVKAPRRLLAPELAAPVRALFSDAALDAYGIKELNILEDVLRRKNAPTMNAVALRIRKKIGWDTPMADEEFLSAYFIALRGRLESRLLFGKRRRDKHEKL